MAGEAAGQTPAGGEPRGDGTQEPKLSLDTARPSADRHVTRRRLAQPLPHHHLPKPAIGRHVTPRRLLTPTSRNDTWRTHNYNINHHVIRASPLFGRHVAWRSPQRRHVTMSLQPLLLAHTFATAPDRRHFPQATTTSPILTLLLLLSIQVLYYLAINTLFSSLTES
ncbi:hypothetical protein FPV67DRAFT_1662992 [Lyophyllum atratum]|nr:hypothetical protein FPV67DRAFT_1662992 [Lyophyllum atratum]